MKLNKAVGKSLTSTSIVPVVPILSSFTLFTPAIVKHYYITNFRNKVFYSSIIFI